MNIYELEELYLQKKIEGMDYSEIRKELQHKGLSKEQINVVVRGIDNKILSGLATKQARSTISARITLGIILLVGGCILTFGSYAGLIDLKGYVFISYGPILTGLGMLIVPQKEKSKKFERQTKFKR